MDENDNILTAFPTHQVTLLFHCPEIGMEAEMMEFMQHAMAVALNLGLRPLASFYQPLPPMITDAEEVDMALSEWTE